MWLKEKEGRDLTKSYGKSPYTNRNVKKATWQHKNVTKKVDYTAIADRLRTVKWSNYGYPTGVVNRIWKSNYNVENFKLKHIFDPVLRDFVKNWHNFIK